MKIGFTGSRRGMTLSQRERVINTLNIDWDSPEGEIDEFHHGDCRGSDEQAFRIAHQLAWTTIAHPGDIKAWRAYTKSDVILDDRPTLVRNRIIVDSVELMLAAPFEPAEITRSGTWATIRYARQQKRSLWIIYRSGKLVREIER